MTAPGEIVYRIFSSAIKSVAPEYALREYADSVHRDFLDMNLKNLIVAGFGKASYQMALSLEETIPPGLISGGVVITKYGHAISQKSGDKKLRRWEDKEIATSQPLDFSGSQHETSSLKIYKAGHPIPDENGLKATGELIELLHSTDNQTLVEDSTAS